MKGARWGIGHYSRRAQPQLKSKQRMATRKLLYPECNDDISEYQLVSDRSFWAQPLPSTLWIPPRLSWCLLWVLCWHLCIELSTRAPRQPLTPEPISSYILPHSSQLAGRGQLRSIEWEREREREREGRTLNRLIRRGERSLPFPL